MRKTQFALAALALVASTAALAEGVTISGRMDVGYQSGSGSADVDTAGATSALSGGLLAPNFLNFSGSEDLGNGMKAMFMSSSTFSSTGGFGSLVSLQSYVGISGNFGTIKTGQTVDSFWGNGVANFDVTGGGNMGSAATTMFMHGASGIFHDNTMQYTLPTMGGLNGAATYVVNDGTSARSTAALKSGDYSIAATYDVNNIKVGAGYSSLDTNKSYFIGAGTELGTVKVNLLYVSSDAAQGNAGAKANTTGINAAVPLIGALSATAGYYKTKGSASGVDGTDTSVGLLYSLSKRTTLFGNYEKATGNTILGFGQNGSGQGTAGDIFTAGVAHSF
jgi:predicted porin